MTVDTGVPSALPAPASPPRRAPPPAGAGAARTAKPGATRTLYFFLYTLDLTLYVFLYTLDFRHLDTRT